MKKTLLIIIPGLFISMIPMVGAYIYYNGPEWVRAGEGFHLAMSCITMIVSIFAGTLYYIIESE